MQISNYSTNDNFWKILHVLFNINFVFISVDKPMSQLFMDYNKFIYRAPSA